MRILSRAHVRLEDDHFTLLDEHDAQTQEQDLNIAYEFKPHLESRAQSEYEADGPGYFLFNLPKMAKLWQSVPASNLFKPTEIAYKPLVGFGKGDAGEGLTPLEALEPLVRPWLETQEQGRSIVLLFYDRAFYRFYELALPL